MNVKQITRALHTLSLLSDEDYDLVLKLRALTEDERGMLMLVLEPSKPAGRKASKKSSSSKSAQSSTKSSRASGMAAQLNKSLGPQREAAAKDITGESDERCTFPRDDGKLCFLLPDHNAHHMKSAVGFHSFQSSSNVSSADNESPANGGATSGTQNSEASAANAQAATAGLSSED